MTTQLVRRRFTTDEYHRMAQAGILSEDDRVELIEGEIVEMAPIGSRHQGCVNRLTALFSRLASDRGLVHVRGPIHLLGDSEPQPDLALLRPRADYYAAAHPSPQDVLLLVEVSDSSADYDRGVKAPLYARYGVLELWIVDLETGVVEMHRTPTAQGYHQVAQSVRGERLTPEALPDLVLVVDDILG